MNLKQAARRLGVHYQTAYRWVRAGRLAAVRVGNGYEISEEAIAQLIAEADAMRRHTVEGERPAADDIDSPDALVRATRGAYASMAMSPRAVFELVSDGLARVLGDLVVVRVVGDNDELCVRAVHHTDARRLSIAWTGIEMYTRTLTEQHERVAITTRKPVLIRHLPQDQLRAQTAPELIQYLDDARPHSLICVPACSGGITRAVVTATREFPSRPYTPDDVAFVMRLAAVVGATVVRACEAQEAWRRRRALMTSLADLGNELDDMVTLAGSGLHDLIDDGNAAELICTIDGRILCANHAAGALGAIEPEKLVGLALHDLPIVEERVEERQLLARLAIGELSFADTDRTLEAEDGTLKHVVVHRGVVRNQAAEPKALVVLANTIPEPEPCNAAFALAS